MSWQPIDSLAGIPKMLHFSISHKLDNAGAGKRWWIATNITLNNSSVTPLNLSPDSWPPWRGKIKGSNNWIDSNLGQRSCHFLLPLHLPPPIVHLGRQFAAWQCSDGTTKTAQDKWLFGRNWWKSELTGRLINMFQQRRGNRGDATFLFCIHINIFQRGTAETYKVLQWK